MSINLDWDVVAAVGQCWDICKARNVPAAGVARLLLAGLQPGEYDAPQPKPVAVVGAAKLTPEPDTYHPYERLGLPPTPPWAQDEDEEGEVEEAKPAPAKRIRKRPEGLTRDRQWRAHLTAWLASQDDSTGGSGDYARYAGIRPAAASQRMKALETEGRVRRLERGAYQLLGGVG